MRWDRRGFGREGIVGWSNGMKLSWLASSSMTSRSTWTRGTLCLSLTLSLSLSVLQLLLCGGTWDLISVAAAVALFPICHCCVFYFDQLLENTMPFFYSMLPSSTTSSHGVISPYLCSLLNRGILWKLAQSNVWASFCLSSSPHAILSIGVCASACVCLELCVCVCNSNQSINQSISQRMIEWMN